jgi:hypothetical protein
MTAENRMRLSHTSLVICDELRGPLDRGDLGMTVFEALCEFEHQMANAISGA